MNKFYLKALITTTIIGFIFISCSKDDNPIIGKRKDISPPGWIQSVWSITGEDRDGIKFTSNDYILTNTDPNLERSYFDIVDPYKITTIEEKKTNNYYILGIFKDETKKDTLEIFRYFLSTQNQREILIDSSYRILKLNPDPTFYYKYEE